VILSVLPKIREVNPFLMDAALDLGLTPFKALVKALIPSLKSGILSGMLLAFTMSFDDFVVSYFTTGNGFDNFSIWIYGAIGRKSLSPTVYAFSSIMTIVTIGFVVILNLKKDKKQNG
jgi:spermidine/putrescine transport system permease protein